MDYSLPTQTPISAASCLSVLPPMELRFTYDAHLAPAPPSPGAPLCHGVSMAAAFPQLGLGFEQVICRLLFGGTGFLAWPSGSWTLRRIPTIRQRGKKDQTGRWVTWAKKPGLGLRITRRGIRILYLVVRVIRTIYNYDISTLHTIKK